MSCGACGAFAPLAGLSPAPAADAAGRVKSRRPDSSYAIAWSDIISRINSLATSTCPQRAGAFFLSMCWQRFDEDGAMRSWICFERVLTWLS